MSVIELMRARHSMRAFDSRPVARDLLLRVLEAARLAPTACNNQPWRMLVVDAPAGLKALAACYPGAWFRTAPAAIVACAVPAEAWRRSDGKNHADIDVAIAVDHLILAAAGAGLGTCWVCAFDAAKTRAALALPAGIEPVVLVPIGYPASDEAPAPRHAQRKPISALVRWESDAPAVADWWGAAGRTA